MNGKRKQSPLPAPAPDLAAQFDELRRRMEDVQRKECPTCKGTGINPEYIPEKPSQGAP